MKVAGVQHDVVWEDRAATLARLEPQLAAAAGTGARLVVLTEMFPSGSRWNRSGWPSRRAGRAPSSSATQAAEPGRLAGRLRPRPPAGRRAARSTGSSWPGPDGELQHYDKIHPFTYSGEHEHYAAGTRRVTFDGRGRPGDAVRLLRPPLRRRVLGRGRRHRLLRRRGQLAGARRAHWQALLVARAIENQAYVVGVNRVGEGGGLTYAGDSRIIDPLGEDRWRPAPAARRSSSPTSTRPWWPRPGSAIPFLADRR